MGLETAVLRFLLRPYLQGFLCSLSVGALLWIGFRLSNFFPLAGNIAAGIWLLAHNGASCWLHDTCALQWLVATIG